jgi:hypothetical protein
MDPVELVVLSKQLLGASIQWPARFSATLRSRARARAAWPKEFG